MTKFKYNYLAISVLVFLAIQILLYSPRVFSFNSSLDSSFYNTEELDDIFRDEYTSLTSEKRSGKTREEYIKQRRRDFRLSYDQYILMTNCGLSSYTLNFDKPKAGNVRSIEIKTGFMESSGDISKDVALPSFEHMGIQVGNYFIRKNPVGKTPIEYQVFEKIGNDFKLSDKKTKYLNDSNGRKLLTLGQKDCKTCLTATTRNGELEIYDDYNGFNTRELGSDRVVLSYNRGIDKLVLNYQKFIDENPAKTFVTEFNFPGAMISQKELASRLNKGTPLGTKSAKIMSPEEFDQIYQKIKPAREIQPQSVVAKIAPDVAKQIYNCGVPLRSAVTEATSSGARSDY